MSAFLLVRPRHAAITLKNLKRDSAAGPDCLGTRVLTRFYSIFAVPLTIISRQILKEGRWPEPWRVHWVFPLYKKKSKANPNNYRGIHLSTQLSKACERLLGR